MGKKKAPKYATTTTDTGLFGKATTSGKGSTFTPTGFQKQLIGVTEANAVNALNNYLNPDYESEDYKRGEEYYTNKMNNMLENNYLNPALSRNLLRGSTASDIMRGFGQDLANTEYERQRQYKADQLQNYMAAMMPYTTIYDMSKGTQGLSNALSNAVSNYNLQAYQANQAGGSGLGAALGAIGTIGGAALGGPIGSALGGMIGKTAGQQVP
jgi:hypothetical protein